MVGGAFVGEAKIVEVGDVVGGSLVGGGFVGETKTVGVGRAVGGSSVAGKKRLGRGEVLITISKPSKAMMQIAMAIKVPGTEPQNDFSSSLFSLLMFFRLGKIERINIRLYQ